MSTTLPPHRAAFALICALLALGGCTTASQARARALEDADVVDGELAILYACGTTVIEEREWVIALEDPMARVFMTEWVEDAPNTRWRLTYYVRVDEHFGPAADAVVARQERVYASDGGAEPTGEPTWRRSPGTTGDGERARQVTDAVTACWQSRSTLAR